MNINLVTNTHYVILWVMLAWKICMQGYYVNANILQEWYLKVINMSLK